MRDDEAVDVLGAGIAQTLEDPFRGLDFGLGDGHPIVSLIGDLEEHRLDTREPFVVRLGEETLVGHHFLGADDAAGAVLDLDRTDERGFGLHGRPPL
ncbi:MAG: hypothetical protein A2W26_13670 [Acidobacteria bacterium RBG_16_64_8]|nr:MAG: hypothetical protein A2W26_13670 [Acidobacteria bacterium RBG_16_64_8]